MENILTGIYSRYSGNATLKNALTGGLHRELAPQATALPYCVYSVPASAPEYWLGGRRFELVSIMFDIYADTNAKRKAAYDALLALYDDSRPTATGYTTTIMARTVVQFLRDGSQNEIFRAIVRYECRYSKD